MKELKGKVAVVTGAASGIGNGLARRFAKEGMKVVLADVEQGALDKAQREIAATGAQTLAVRTDVTDGSSVASLAEQTVKAFGGVHLVVNNAGVGGDSAFLWEQTEKNWQWVIAVNLMGVAHGIRSFIPIMLEKGEQGHMVNTASMSGFTSGTLQGPYYATKHAVVVMTEMLHHELQQVGAKIGVSLLSPGFAATNIMDADRNRPATFGKPRELSEQEREYREYNRQIMKQGMAPDEIAECVVKGVRANQFYLFPDPDWLESIEGRMGEILRQETPTQHLPQKVRKMFGLE